ncbi:MAG: hypothetical protein JW765_05350 [Deltaproteobacteria bacterium]|nr:hypothetical protein [Candidatus Zymogenaceae bacterium]
MSQGKVTTVFIRRIEFPTTVTGKMLYHLLDVNPAEESLVLVRQNKNGISEKYRIEPGDQFLEFITWDEWINWPDSLLLITEERERRTALEIFYLR